MAGCRSLLFWCPMSFSGLPAGITTRWHFVPGKPPVTIRARRIGALLKAGPRPQLAAVIPAYPAQRWTVFFVYAPNGRINLSHLYTLERLRALTSNLLVIVASPSAEQIPPLLYRYCDSLYWKGLGGYDFSAYTAGLEILAARSPGARALILNDSMFGPLTDCSLFIEDPPWELTGFTASSLDENHIQSYAFVLDSITPARVKALREAFPRLISFSSPDAVILWQELRFARIAARTMSVGAHWFSNHRQVEDPCLVLPYFLVECGLPFLKKSLLGKMAHFQKPTEVRKFLARYDHPLDWNRSV